MIIHHNPTLLPKLTTGWQHQSIKQLYPCLPRLLSSIDCGLPRLGLDELWKKWKQHCVSMTLLYHVPETFFCQKKIGSKICIWDKKQISMLPDVPTVFTWISTHLYGSYFYAFDLRLGFCSFLCQQHCLLLRYSSLLREQFCRLL